MIDREGRVVFGSLLVFVVAVAGSIVVEQQTGVALRDRPLFAFLVFAGIGVALPQLYLAVTETGPRSRSRLRFAAVATAVFAVAFADDASGARYLLIASIGTGSILAVLCHEALEGYRAVSDEVTFDLRDR
ncbi:hypothetical protein CP556_04635 [Natrinema sp. CBA1119]|uniref:hypothetical protein n=1 Tax=Natrinema sp. CBA1119 TaxID=1608465 RepID=UPI000BF905C2|nr:hypothetical protein [Natrinema sp. CBA1119]PGF15485.1 hypothetical protein CP556_04635 [Natrinema sp. CBA1119]